ncbi:hypothetical protein [Ekhidna sp.]|uniref:hypothetical protein n=1 Tax=Ekhidna sp. TaxID=2608089 RepID=UPI00329699FE
MRLIFHLLVIVSPLILSAQKNVKFGDVSLAELQLQVYDQDSSASAVVLYDKGEFKTNGEFTRHRRIKILTNAGKSYANLALNIPSKGNISAFVFNLENGQIVKEKLNNSSIYSEEIFDGFHIYKIFLPNVKVGSVIDIRYMHYGIPFEWRFQETIPVVYNELKLERTQYVIFEKQQRGFGEIEKIAENHYKAENVPAFVIEPNVSHYSNYITKFEFQLTKITVPGYFYENISTSWPSISEELMEHYRFGQIIENSGYLKDSIKIWNKKLTEDEKIHKAYYHMRDEISWNNQNRLFVSQFQNKKLKNEKQGSSADINLTLIAMLKAMDVEVYPVILSTRENGLLNPLIPNLWKVNYVLAYVITDKGGIYLDASDKNLVPGLIPQKCLNGNGWLILGSNDGQWVSLNSSNVAETYQMVNIFMTDVQSPVAEVSQKISSLKYLEWIKRYKEFESDDRFRIHLKDKFQVDVESYQSKIKPEKAIVTEVFNADLDEAIIDLGQELLLDPFVFCGFASNPFKSVDRTAPIDLVSKLRERSTINITLPDNLIVGELPKSEAISTLNKGIVFVVNYSQLGNKLQIQYTFEINETVFPQEDYQTLKNFYSHIIDKIEQPIRFVKKT